ncbi:hypothetical protein DQ238_14775 [Geodermatophilus sp. TF02-6]|nr:hypothetical protein DQ238_14775 [Geodermatophilus sp. TF02-6]
MQQIDSDVVRRTLAFLVGVAALPVATGLIVHNAQVPEAVAVTAGLLALTSALAFRLYRWALGPRGADVDPDLRRRLLVRPVSSAVVFLAAVPLAYLLPRSSYAPLVWGALLVTRPASDRFAVRRSTGRPGPDGRVRVGHGH